MRTENRDFIYQSVSNLQGHFQWSEDVADGWIKLLWDEDWGG